MTSETKGLCIAFVNITICQSIEATLPSSLSSTFFKERWMCIRIKKNPDAESCTLASPPVDGEVHAPSHFRLKRGTRPHNRPVSTRLVR